MSKIFVKKDKAKINDGGHNAFGVDVDPNKTLKHCTNPDCSYDAYYKDQKINYDDYISELEGRYHRKAKGKSVETISVGFFSGFGKGTLNKKNN